jgi:hypothetical protein
MPKRFLEATLLIVTLLLAACGSSTRSPAQPATPPPTPTLTPDQLIGKPVKGSGPSVYRVMEDGHLRHLLDWATFLAWGYQPGEIVQLSDQAIASYPLGGPLTRWVTGETEHTRYFLRRGQRFPLDDAALLAITGGSEDMIISLPDDLLHRFPQAAQPLAVPDSLDQPVPTPGAFARTFPDPRTDYVSWLQTWPRPAHDNGRCLHAVAYPAGDRYEVLEQIARLEQINARWVLVNYTDRAQLHLMAPLFAQAGIKVIWRPFVRPYETYDHWADDVQFLIASGQPPYIQVYNEPSLGAEWDGQPVDQALYLDHVSAALHAVYAAGGLPGLQTINPDWTRAVLQRLKTESDVFDRLFYVPHMYGGNHPPEYDADIYSVIGGFQAQARVFQEEIGFVPPMIAGEGGWRPGEASDTRYPAITEEMHRDYHVAVFEWFRTGELSNGDPLPDYLFAWCPWLLSDPFDPAAWWDSASGDRTLTIDAVAALPDFERRFSWRK